VARGTGVAVVLVDTTVWVDFFNNKNTPHVQALERLVTEEEDVCTCGVILAEVLQGIRTDHDYRKTLSRFEAFLFLPMDRHTFVKAAELYRTLRSRGITIRKTVDCMIAAVAIEHRIPLLHNDKDFDPISKFCGLLVLNPETKKAQL
jgi:predicted nucleic acid-binding protein